MGREYTESDTRQYVTILHSSTHPLLGLRGEKTDATRENLEAFAEKAKAYRRAITNGTVYTSRSTINATTGTKDRVKKMKGYARHDKEVQRAFNKLEEAHERVQGTLESTVIDDDIGPQTDKLHRDICRTLGMQGTIGYGQGTEFTRALTIAVYHAREGTDVHIYLEETDSARAKIFLQQEGLERKITIKSPKELLQEAEKN